MKVFGAIIGWIFGLLFAVIMFLSALTIIPLSVMGEQLLVRENGMQIIEAASQDEVVMDQLTTGMLNVAASAFDSDAPGLKAALEKAADPESEVGVAVRNLLDRETMAENVKTNADNFYDWMDGDVDNMVVEFKFGGTISQWEDVLSLAATDHIESLPTCTSSQLQGMLENPDLSNIDCLPPGVNTEQINEFTKVSLDDVAVRDAIRDGVEFPLNGGEALKRENLIMLKEIASAGIIAGWVVIGISVLLMLALFSPRGVNRIATGLVTGFTAISLMSFGGQALTFVANNAQDIGGVDGVQPLAKVFAEIIGAPIAKHGMYLLGLSVLLVIWGIYYLAKGGKKKVKVEKVVKVEDKVVVKEADAAIMGEVTSPKGEGMNEANKEMMKEVKPTSSSDVAEKEELENKDR